MKQTPERRAQHVLRELIKSGKVTPDEIRSLVPGQDGPVVTEPTLTAEQMFTNPKSWDLPELKPLVEGFFLWDCVHCFAGLFESFKTMAALELMSAIREKRKAFDYFEVCLAGDPPEILYLCPDMPHSLFRKYVKNFGIYGDPGFRALDPKCDIIVAIDGEALQREVKGKLLVLDTMLDFARIKDANKSDEWVEFFQKLRRLISVHGCRGILLVTHPTKAGARNTVIDPTEFLKDSVTFGGKLDVGYAFRAVDESSKVFVQRIKGRGFERRIQFTISPVNAEGQSTLDEGRFPVVNPPDDCGDLREHLPSARKGGNPGDPDREQKKKFLRGLLSQNLGIEQMRKALNEKFPGKQHSASTVKAWVRDIRREPAQPNLDGLDDADDTSPF